MNCYPKLDCRLVQRVYSQTDRSNDEITQWKLEKNKPKNPGLKGHLNPGFGFKKSLGYPGFLFSQTRVAHPDINQQFMIYIIKSFLVIYETYIYLLYHSFWNCPQTENCVSCPLSFPKTHLSFCKMFFPHWSRVARCPVMDRTARKLRRLSG